MREARNIRFLHSSSESKLMRPNKVETAVYGCHNVRVRCAHAYWKPYKGKHVFNFLISVRNMATKGYLIFNLIDSPFQSGHPSVVPLA